MNPATPTEVIALLVLLQQLKPFAICTMLECDQEQANEISRAFDQEEFATALYMIQCVGDKALVHACEKYRPKL